MNLQTTFAARGDWLIMGLSTPFHLHHMDCFLRRLSAHPRVFLPDIILTEKARQFAVVLPFYLFCASSLAAPAPWYKWRSKLTSQQVCAQTSPGTGWERVKSAYQDARCKIPGRPDGAA